MRARVILWISLVLNLVLVWFLVKASGYVQPAGPALERVERAGSGAPTVKTNVVVRRQNFTWDEIESRDYATYINNLKAIGCPAETIRDIILADVNHLYAQKKLQEVVTPDQQWWRSDPDPNLLNETLARQNALEEERRALLTQLLGAGWERASSPSLAAFGSINLSGGGFANLTAEARQAVQQLHTQGGQRVRAYLQEMQQANKSPDPAELARLNQQTRQELAKVLSQEQLEEYLLRHSPQANSLRNELRGLAVTQDEFRNVFNARDPFDQQIQQLQGLTDPASAKRREDLERQRDLAIERALAPEHAQLYKLNQDPVFRQAQSVATQSGAPPEAVMPLYQIQQATQQEIQRLRSDANLSPEDLDRALLEIEATQRKSLRQVLGEQAFDRFMQSNRKN